jgi:rhodanese-related sulfurtransferase
MGRKWLLPILIFIGIFVFASQGLKGGPEISAPETAALMNGTPRPLLVDLRDPADYEKGHIAGALSVPSAAFKERLADLKLPKQDTVVLYSNDDAQTRAATRLLYENGYQGALTLKGGVTAWQAAGQPLTKPAAAKP